MFDRKNEGRWWDFGWQLVEGCTKISPACDNCWSLAKEKRFRKEKGVVFHNERLERPLKRKKPTSYAIWNDLFHKSVDFQDIIEIFLIMKKCPQHTFQILTKRPDIMKDFFEYAPNPYWENLPNVWLGTTIENQNNINRIDDLLECPAKIHFISVEPMLSAIDLNKIAFQKFKAHLFGNITQYGLDWVICGGESGHNARPMHPDWVRSLRDQCQDANVPFFFKQWHKKSEGSEIDGKEYKQFPKIKI